MTRPTTFTIPGPPVAKQRPRMNRKTGNVYTPNETRNYEASVWGYSREAGVKLRPGRVYAIEITFFLSSLRKDQDNLVKAILDGMFPRAKGAADDRQVVDMLIHTRPVQDATEERTVVSVEDRGEAFEWMRPDHD